MRKLSSLNRCARAPHSAYAAGVGVANLLEDPFVWRALWLGDYRHQKEGARQEGRGGGGPEMQTLIREART